MKKPVADIHAHILPGLDDGARDWEEAVRMLDISISMGIRCIIATPHYSRRLHVDQVREQAQELERKAREQCGEFKVYPGQEILYSDGIVEMLKEGKAMTLADSRYVLVEFMPDVSYQTLYQGICKILRGGYYPVAAHVERYGVLRQKGHMEEVLETGCLLQMNYSGLQGGLPDRNVRWCRNQILQKRIHLLGTDMHHDTWRSPDIRTGLGWLGRHTGPDWYEALTWERTMEIIKNGQSRRNA